jgi:hypothetical protein
LLPVVSADSETTKLRRTRLVCAGWKAIKASEGDFADELIAARMTKEQADVAQLVEQLIRNQQVNGSSPFVGSINLFDASAKPFRCVGAT